MVASRAYRTAIGIGRPIAVSDVAVTALVAFVGESHATLVGCPPSFTTDGTAKVNDGGSGSLTAAGDRQYITPPNPSTVANTTTIDSNAFCGHDDWEENSPTQTQVDVDSASGSWSINGVDFATFDYAIFFKAGNDTNIVGFLFNELFSSGEWTTPFTEPPFDFAGTGKRQADVGHFSIFRRSSDAQQAPEPSALLLLGVGSLGFGLALLRHRRRTSV